MDVSNVSRSVFSTNHGKSLSLFSQTKNQEATGPKFSFTDLAPIDDADHESSYFYALKYALDNDKVFNIAVSGPYGSGKTSILNSYQLKNGCSFVNISLASFGKSELDEVDASIIEKSILQQLLYRVDAKKVPFSRYKRIVPVRLLYVKAVLIAVWLILAYHYWQQDTVDLLSNLKSYLGISWSLIRILPVVFVFIGWIMLVASVLTLSIGLAKMKLSLPGFEVETDKKEPASILSANLDEIFYFFEATGEQVVIFEDLDRFEKPEIFHKLREINKLLNDGRPNSKKVKFIYAIRDDIFLQSDRTKFFDFIIPVVPIVNSSNSLDKFRELLRKCDALGAIDDQFLRDVCYHLIDLRLIKNIVNEFEIYLDRLPVNERDKTQLLAMMVYKNVYSQDFEALHYQKGKLFQVCMERDKFEQISKSSLIERKVISEKAIEHSYEETSRNVNELIAAYVMPILSLPRQPQHLGIYSVWTANKEIQINELLTLEALERLIDYDRFGLSTQANSGPPQERHTFKVIENTVDPNHTFRQRKEAVENRAGEKRSKLEHEVREITTQIAKIKHKRLRELLNENLEYLDIVLENSSTGELECDYALLRSLLLNGYLDENFSDFTSNFHEGRLGRNDLEFLRTIRAGRRIDAELNLDHPAEVCIDMNASDFESDYVLNVSLLDHLLLPNTRDSKETTQAITYIAKNFKKSDSFLGIYYENGVNTKELIVRLVENWDLISVAVYESARSLDHIAMVVKFCDHKVIVDELNSERQFMEFIENFGPIIEKDLSGGFSQYELYKDLDVCFPSLVALNESKALLKFAIANTMYKINLQNILAVFTQGGDSAELRTHELKTSSYTTVLESGNELLKSYIDENIESYVRDVLLALPENQSESGEAIIHLLNNDRVNVDSRLSFVSQQKHVFVGFDGIPEEFMSEVFQRGNVAISWRNIAIYQNSSVFSQDILTGLLEEPRTLDALQSTRIADAELEREEEYKFGLNIIENEQLTIDTYTKLINFVQLRYESFPAKISRDKRLQLLAADKIALTKESFDAVIEDTVLATRLIFNHEKLFLAEIDEFAITDEIRSSLLASEFGIPTKVAIIQRTPPESVQENKALAKEICSLICGEITDLSGISYFFIKLAFDTCSDTPVAVALLTRFAAVVQNIAELMELVAQLDSPFRNIAEAGKHPKIPNTKTNLKFAIALESLGAISSYTSDEKYIKINTYK
jgi:hypothetical protein